ncbi:MAG: AAA family ATPase [Anaerolineales bacterium]|nr:AAA family ATPase [Anaerolineales bacterium]
MNNNASQNTYRERWLTPLLQDAIKDHPVIVLTGARQVGKSTLLFNTEPFRNWRFHTLDDFDVLEQARSNPESLWAGTNQVILDEVQKAPELLLAVKKTVDRNPGKYQFVLSGSANLLLMKQVSESLAGRAIYFVLDPMSVGEMNNRPYPDILVRVLNGEFPEESSLTADLPDPAEFILRGLCLHSSVWILRKHGQGGGKGMLRPTLSVIFGKLLKLMRCWISAELWY